MGDVYAITIIIPLLTIMLLEITDLLPDKRITFEAYVDDF